MPCDVRVRRRQAARAPAPPGRPPGTWTPSTSHGAAAGAAVADRAFGDAWSSGCRSGRPPRRPCVPSGVAASARGVSPKSSRIVSGVPPRRGAEVRRVEDPDQRARRALRWSAPAAPTPGRFWPRRAVVMKARVKTPPRRSARRRRCRAARRRPAACARRAAASAATSTMLTLSDRWLTTQTSLLVRAATATGSRPTGTEPTCVSAAAVDGEDLEPVVGRVEREQPCSPSGESASGRTWPLSKVTKDASAGAGAEATASPARAAPTRRVADDDTETPEDAWSPAESNTDPRAPQKRTPALRKGREALSSGGSPPRERRAPRAPRAAPRGRSASRSDGRSPLPARARGPPPRRTR